jgi:hypothetical protein
VQSARVLALLAVRALDEGRPGDALACLDGARAIAETLDDEGAS